MQTPEPVHNWGVGDAQRLQKPVEMENPIFYSSPHLMSIKNPPQTTLEEGEGKQQVVGSGTPREFDILTEVPLSLDNGLGIN